MREILWIEQAHPLHQIKAACGGDHVLRIPTAAEAIWFVPLEVQETKQGHKVFGYTVEGDRVRPSSPITRRHEEAIYCLDQRGATAVLCFDNPKNPAKIEERSPISGSDAVAV